MNDFNNDFDNFDDNEFNDFKSDNSLKSIWQNNPLLKIFVVISGVILVIAAIIIFGGSDDEIQSRVSNAPDDREVLGGEISANYADVLEQVNEQRLDRAVQTGTSTIPMLINPEEQELLTQSEELPPYNEFDPLATFRAAIDPGEATVVPEEEPVLVAPEDVFAPQQQTVPAPSPEAVQALAQAMAQSVGNILGNHTPTAPRITQVTPENYYELLAEAEAQRLESNIQMVDTNGDGIPDTALNNSGVGVTDNGEVIVQNVLIPAGTINYAQVLIEANSDVPGPVLAQLVSGPLTGARLIGTFSVQNEFLVLTFNSIVVNGLNQSVNAIAIDPGTTLPGVASEVDRRYWTRVLLPAGARFLEGIGSAIAEDTQTTVTVSGDTVIEQQDALDFEQELGRGVEEGFREIADFMDDEADDVQVLVRVARGTPIGVFFTEPVLEGQ
jgi:intracellular multiplication protein IcmE